MRWDALLADDIGVGLSLVLALGSVLMLAALHLAAPHIRRLPGVPEHATASFAGGLAVSYVFLHLLPRVARGSREVSDMLGESFTPGPLLELAIFAVALVGFALYYGLERLAEQATRTTRSSRDSPRGEPNANGKWVFAVHLGAFTFYNGVIGYSLPTNWRVSPAFAVLFTVAIGLHFLLTDRGLEEHYGRWFDRMSFRAVLAAGLVAGWLLAVPFAPTRTVVVSVLTAFLGGGVLLNVFKEEIPSGRGSHFGWFTTGLVFYGALLALATSMHE